MISHYHKFVVSILVMNILFGIFYLMNFLIVTHRLRIKSYRLN